MEIHINFFSIIHLVILTGKFYSAKQRCVSAGIESLPLTRTSSAINLTERLLRHYDKKTKPTYFLETPINVTYNLDLYQILELKWYDEILFWEPADYDNVSELYLPYDIIWMPDTTLYNSVLMKDEDIRRLQNVKLTQDGNRKATLVEMLYPAIYQFSCLLNLHWFPFDVQVCTMTVSSWTHDNTQINYFFAADNIGRRNFLENEAWELIKSSVKRIEKKYDCCPHEYTLLKMTLYLRRKPLFYLVNLIIPTSIITLISLFGFFTSSSATEVREQKVSLGLTTLLSMSILLLMISDEMPTTSTFVPLMGWYILSMIGLTALAVIATACLIHVQKMGSFSKRLSPDRLEKALYLGKLVQIETPAHLIRGTEEYNSAPPWRLRTRPSHMAVQTALLLSLFPQGGEANNHISVSEQGESEIRRERTTSFNGSNAKRCDRSSTASLNRCGTPDGRSATSTERLPLIALAPMDAHHHPHFKNHVRRASSNNIPLSRLIGEFQENSKINQKLAKIEYEWLANVFERCCFVGFLAMFAVLNLGINLIGFVHWLQSPETL